MGVKRPVVLDDPYTGLKPAACLRIHQTPIHITQPQDGGGAQPGHLLSTYSTVRTPNTEGIQHYRSNQYQEHTTQSCTQ